MARDADQLGRIAGTFSDDAGRVRADERVTARLVPEGIGVFADAEVSAGRFVFEGVAAGRYLVRILAAGRVVARSELLDLAPGAALDIGVLTTLPAGSLAVEFVVPPGVALPEGGAYVTGPNYETRPLRLEAGTWRADGLNPGRHTLSTYFTSLAEHHEWFDVEEGSEKRLRVALSAGVERTLVFVPAPGVGCSEVQVVVNAGPWATAFPVIGVERLEHRLTLAPGHYEVEATTSTGLAARGAFDISDQSAEHAEIAFELR